MARDEQRKAECIEAIITLLPEDLRQFAAELFQGLSRADLQSVPAEEFAAAARSLWDFSEQRKPGEAKLRLVQNAPWSSAPIIAEIVNDDMPFLVDSVTAMLNRYDLGIDLIVHPVLTVARDVAGKRTGFGAASQDGKPESIMQIRLSGSGDPAEIGAVQAELAHVLADVRAAVTDWRAMLHKLALVTAELDDPALLTSRVSAEDVAESKAFLRWLLDDHMTLLGYREIRFETERGEPVMRVVDETGLGVLRDPSVQVFEGVRNLAALPPDVRGFLQDPTPLLVAKSNARSTVHRPVPMDVVGVKQVDKSGHVVAERRFVGLFTSTAYNQNVRDIPLLRRKVAKVIDRAGLDPRGHDGKALMQILETYPRDELFQITAEDLYEIAMGILQLQDRRRIALFTRRDPFERFVSCLVYIPQDQYSSSLRDRVNKILAQAFAGQVTASYIQLAETPLARLHIIVKTVPGAIPDLDMAALEAKLIEAGRGWADQLQAALTRSGERSASLFRRYVTAFPSAYTEQGRGGEAVDDIARIEALTPEAPGVWLYRRDGAAPGELSFKIYGLGKPIALSDVLPVLENRGLRVHTEVPHKIVPEGFDKPVWIQDFDLIRADGSPVDVAAVRDRFHAGFLASWRGQAEEDGFNRLILEAGLDWREVAVLRAYGKYLRQAGFTFSQAYIEQTLAKHEGIAALLVRLFHARFDPSRAADKTRAAGVVVEIEHALDGVSVLDEDRILRRYVNLIQVTLRTNWYQPGADGQPKPYISFKLDSRLIEDLPKPRPFVEVWVYSPDVEAVHLRQGPVARGGIRWSDRREDFRTEILGLVKAQNVKNAVIVPVGSKGGFVVKRPPAPDAGRAALQAQVVECYKTFMRGMLDVTDNRVGTEIVAPKSVVRHDGDDPYLVVAADKGTATFSDIANGVARDYGFWLDDAFASGGSAGYDHKVMGITARGAWVAVERHFRELGYRLETDVIKVIGVGDMSGDVFGNGLLHSNRLKLVAAFNHLHIFLDPEPADLEASFAERERLFKTPGSSWTDYKPELISKGGGVFERSAKSLKVSPEVKALLGIERDSLSPAELMQAILKADTDLLWFGGIGTYVKSTTETNVQAGDRANDALRIDGRELRAKVVGEGANLGVTQAGRIEYATRGGKINTDAIDNSAGVDTSDHEVNIKILLALPIASGRIDRAERDKLLASMTDEVGLQVLRDNYLQTFAMSAAERDGPEFVDSARRLMEKLERETGLDRPLEGLPSDALLADRRAAGQGLYRPELAVLLAWAKIAFYNALLPSTVPDDPALGSDLAHYFPQLMRDEFPEEIKQHGLRREIVATGLTNELVNRGGIAFAVELEQQTGAHPADLAKGFVVARALLGLPALWADIEALDGKADALAQIDLYRATARATEAAVRWLVGQGVAEPIDALIERLRAPVEALLSHLPVSDTVAAPGVPAELAQRVQSLQAGVRTLDVVVLASESGRPVAEVAEAWFQVSARFGFDQLRGLAAAVPTPDGWSRQAVGGLIDDLGRHQGRLTRATLGKGGAKAPGGVEGWTAEHQDVVSRLDRMIADLQTGGTPDLARLAVLERNLRDLLAD